ncbi:hypothetical protein B6J67_28340 [Klebsiella quasipneumoniae]|nr:hypothetical protein B6J67_28340 [Klebsiella quasipneumoniae]PLJ64240.1 hypothetical protein B6J68_08560 [Klebsiella quasipneumoniae]
MVELQPIFRDLPTTGISNNGNLVLCLKVQKMLISIVLMHHLILLPTLDIWRTHQQFRDLYFQGEIKLVRLSGGIMGKLQQKFHLMEK